MQPTVNTFFKRLACVTAAAVAIAGFAVSGASPAGAAGTDAAAEHPMFRSHDRSQSVWLMSEEGKGNDSLLTLLKTDAATLQNELRAGKSLADIAKEKGVDRQKVVDLLVAQQKARLAEAVKAGKLTKEQADKWSEKLVERTEKFVDRKDHFSGHHHGHAKQGFKSRLNDTAQVLGMTPEQLLDELKKGKSIAQVGKEKGVSEDTIVSKLLEKEKVRIQDRIHRVWDKNHQAKATESEAQESDKQPSDAE